MQRCPHLEDVDTSIDILRHLGCAGALEGPGPGGGFLHPDPLGHSGPAHAAHALVCDVSGGHSGPLRPGGAVVPRRLRAGAPAHRPAPVRSADSGSGASGRRAARLRLHGASACTGAEIVLSIPSVGATENAMLAACGAQGVTTISNAAREPEIVDLQAFLQKPGGQRIRGRGQLHRHGGRAECPFTAVSTAVIGGPHRGGYLPLRRRPPPAERCSCTGQTTDHLSTVTGVAAAGGRAASRSRSDGIRLTSPDGACGRSPPVRTAPYPGFPTDAQAVLMAALLRSRGTTVFVENMFRKPLPPCGRSWCRMGADIRVEGRVAVVCGVGAAPGRRGCGPRTFAAARRSVCRRAAGRRRTTMLSSLHHIRPGLRATCPGICARLGAEIRIHDREPITRGGDFTMARPPQTQTQPPANGRAALRFLYKLLTLLC